MKTLVTAVLLTLVAVAPALILRGCAAATPAAAPTEAAAHVGPCAPGTSC